MPTQNANHNNEDNNDNNNNSSNYSNLSCTVHANAGHINTTQPHRRHAARVQQRQQDAGHVGPEALLVGRGALANARKRRCDDRKLLHIHLDGARLEEEARDVRRVLHSRRVAAALLEEVGDRQRLVLQHTTLRGRTSQRCGTTAQRIGWHEPHVVKHSALPLLAQSRLGLIPPNTTPDCLHHRRWGKHT